jgi:hypothetical protein
VDISENILLDYRPHNWLFRHVLSVVHQRCRRTTGMSDSNFAILLVTSYFRTLSLHELGTVPQAVPYKQVKVFCRLIIVLTCGLGELAWGAANLFIDRQTPLRTHETHQ